MREVEVTWDDIDCEWTAFEDDPTNGRIYNKVDIEEFQGGEKLYSVWCLSDTLEEGILAGIKLIKAVL